MTPAVATDARTREVLRRLELDVTRRLDGLLQGDYRGLVSGLGSEPGEARVYTAGDDVIRHYASSSDHDRVFCGNCGSNILVALDGEPDNYYVSMSIFEGDPPRPPGYHIYVGSKAPWHEIVDDLPKYDEDVP